MQGADKKVPEGLLQLVTGQACHLRKNVFFLLIRELKPINEQNGIQEEVTAKSHFLSREPREPREARGRTRSRERG